MKFYFNNSNTGGYPNEQCFIGSANHYKVLRMLAKLIKVGATHLHLNYFYDNENISVDMVD